MAVDIKGRITLTDDSKQGTESAKKNIKDVKDAGLDFSNALKGAIAAISFDKITQEVGVCINKFADAELASKRLEVLSKNNPLMNGESAANLEEYAAAMEKSTGIADDLIVSQEAMLTGMGKSESQIKKIMTAAIQLSATGITPLDNAVKACARSLDGQSDRTLNLFLKTENLTEGELKAGEGLDILIEKLGGTAEAMTEGAGKTDLLLGRFDKIQEVIGRVAFEALEPIIDIVIKACNWFLSLDKNTQNLIVTIGGIALTAPIVATALSSIGAAFGLTFGPAGLAVVAIGATVAALATLISWTNKQAEAEDKAIQKLKEYNNSSQVYYDQLRLQVGKAGQQSFLDFSGNAAKPIDIQIGFAQEEIKKVEAQLAEIRRTGFAGINVTSEKLQLQLEGYKKVLVELQGMKTGGIDPMRALREAAEKRIAEAFEKIQKQLNIGVINSSDAQSQRQDIVVQQFQSLLEQGYNFQLENGQKMIEKFAEYLPGVEWNITAKQIDWVETPGSGPRNSPDYLGQLGGQFNGTQAGQLAGGADPLSMLFTSAAQAALSIDSLNAVLNPFQTVFSEIVRIIEPVVNMVLAPIVGILIYIGKLLGTAIAPILQVFQPLLLMIAQAFLLFYPAWAVVVNAFIIVGNAAYNLYAAIYNAIGYILKTISLGFGGWDSIGFKDIMEGTISLTAPTMADLTGAGANYSPNGEGGSAANYQKQSDYYIYITNHVDNVVGEDGMTQFAMMLRDIIKKQEAMGY